MQKQQVAKLFLALFLALCACGSFAADAISKSAPKVRAGTVTIQVRTAESDEFFTVGTGWLYANQDTVVTARHVVEFEPGEITDMRVGFFDGAYADVDAVAMSGSHDVAVIDLEDADVAKAKRNLLKLARTEAVFGEEVYTVGHPMGEDGYLFHLTTGRVTNDNEADIITHSVALIGGNSGGALCNVNGEVTGIAVMRDRRDNVFSFSVSLKVLKAQLTGLVKASKNKGASRPLRD